MYKSLTSERALLVIILLGCIVFFNGVFNRFVNDDTQLIVNNPMVHSVKNIGTIFVGGSFFNGTGTLSGVYYRPVPLVVFTILYQTFGQNYSLYHLFQILIHITNAGILFLVLDKFFRKHTAFLLSLIFLVHPATSEAVFYISAMQEVLYFFFGILACFIIVNTIDAKLFLTVVPLIILSILSKETGVLFIGLIGAYIWMHWKNLWKRFLIISVTGMLGYAYLRHITIGIFTKPPVSPIDYLTLWQRLVNTPQILWTYVTLIFFPLRLSSSYRWAFTVPDFPNFYVPLLSDILVFGVSVFIGYRLRRIAPKPVFQTYVFFSLWTVIGFALLSQVIPLDMTIAERWLYFPIVGILGMAAALAESVHIDKNRIAAAIGILIVSLMSIRTVVRSFDWRDDYSLARHDSTVTVDNYDLENAIGVGLTQEKKFPEAETHIKRSIALFSNFQNYNNLAILYVHEGKFKEAKQIYTKSLALTDSYMTYENLAFLGILSNDQTLGVDFVNLALAKYPYSYKLWTALALLKYQEKESTAAAQAINNAYRLQNDETTKTIYDTIRAGKPLR